MDNSLNEENILSLKKEVEGITSTSSSKEKIDIIRREWLGKDGKFKILYKKISELPSDARVVFAKDVNELKNRLETYIESSSKNVTEQQHKSSLANEFYDLSLPGLHSGLGAVHPITQCEKLLYSIVKQHGFQSVVGPEIETDFFCFDALNVPQHHPARDLQDTFYTDTGHVLRTHCTAVSARSAAKGKLPIKSVSLGRAYRNEAEDASHTAMFHQFDLVWIDKGLTLAHLMGLIQEILKELYGKRRKVRFVRKFYPYTEPSIGPQVDCSQCKGNGCAACGGSGWITVAGAGVLHKNVMNLFNYDTEKVTGLAFGMGTSRLASQMFGFTDIRVPYSNDLRVINNLK